MELVDGAKRCETAHRQDALDRQQEAAKPDMQPLIIHGLRHCVDCLELICPGRIEAYPQAVRCLDCQELKEREKKQWT